MNKINWTNKKLRDVCIVQAGQGAPQGDENYANEGIPFVKAGNLNDLITGRKESDIQKVPEKVASRHKLKLFKAGSVLFAKSGMSCLKGYVYTLEKDCYVVSHLAILTPKNITSGYLNYYLKYNKPNSLIKDSAYPSISLSDIENMRISVPDSIIVEKRIVSELDSLNESINLLQKQVKDIDSLSKSLFHNTFGDPIINEKGWDNYLISEIFRVKSSKRVYQNELKSYGIPFLRVADIIMMGNGKNVIPELYISKEKYDELKKLNLVPQTDDLLITARGTLGKVYIVSENDKFYFQDGMITWLENRSKKVDPIFFKYLLEEDHFHHELIKTSSISTVAFISIANISKKKVILPPITLQKTFAQKVKALEDTKSYINAQIADLQTLLAARMQYWFD